jgi:hypothetical protein
MSDRRRATLAPSWIGRSVSGGSSATARLLTTVPRPQQAAARISARAVLRCEIEADMSELRARHD